MFRKYPSLNNHHNTKTISKYLNMFPELETEPVVVQEKLDGANVQIYITEDEYRVGKRTSLLEPTESFFNWQQVVAKYENYIEKIQEFLITSEANEVILYGELFGGNTQNRVSYTEERQILVYDMVGDGDNIPQTEFYDFMNMLDIQDWIVPTFHYGNINFYEAMNFDVENTDTQAGNDSYNPYSNKKLEGVVIKPLNNVYKNQDSVFAVKLKSKLFNDKMKVKHKPKTVTPLTVEGERLKAEFKSYVTDNRIKDWFSKEGVIESQSQIGLYLKGITEDIKQEFFEANKEAFIQLPDLDKGKVLGSASKDIVDLLRNYL